MTTLRKRCSPRFPHVLCFGDSICFVNGIWNLIVSSPVHYPFTFADDSTAGGNMLSGEALL